MKRDEEQNTARIIGIILFCSGFIIICMTGSKAMDGHNNFYYALGTLFSILGLYLFFAHNFPDLNLELAFYLSFMSFLLTFALFFTKAYDDITAEKKHSFIPGVNDEGIAITGMSVFYTLFFVFLLVFIYRKINTTPSSTTLKTTTAPWSQTPPSFPSSSIRMKNLPEYSDDPIEATEKYVEDTGDFEGARDYISDTSRNVDGAADFSKNIKKTETLPELIGVMQKLKNDNKDKYVDYIRGVNVHWSNFGKLKEEDKKKLKDKQNLVQAIRGMLNNFNNNDLAPTRDEKQDFLDTAQQFAERYRELYGNDYDGDILDNLGPEAYYYLNV